ncbi:MAG: hypothetical protein ACYDAR_18810 [Thermomicrobiales bacterium]
MRGRSLSLLIIVGAAMLAACSGQSAPVVDTQATTGAIRNANATTIAASLPTAAPTDTPIPAATVAPTKPAAPTAAAAQPVGATPAATKPPAGQLPLTQSLVGPNRCIAVRYPQGWTVMDNSLLDGTTDYCPGGAQRVATTVRPVCDATIQNGSDHQLFVVMNAATADSSNQTVILYLADERCQQLDDEAAQVFTVDPSDTTTKIGPIYRQSVAGAAARCADATQTQSNGPTIQFTGCLFFLSGDAYEVVSASSTGDTATVQAILSTVEVHPIGR